MVRKSRPQTIPTYTDTLHVFSTVEGTRSQLAQGGWCRPFPDPRSACLSPELLLQEGTLSQGPLHSKDFSKLNSLIYAGYLSYRHDEKGSAFIQILTDVFTNKTGPITELLEEVRQLSHLGPLPRLSPSQPFPRSPIFTNILGLLSSPCVGMDLRVGFFHVFVCGIHVCRHTYIGLGGCACMFVHGGGSENLSKLMKY